MKSKLFSIFLTFVLFLTLYLPTSHAQDYTQWNLPEGAKARLGKGEALCEFSFLQTTLGLQWQLPPGFGTTMCRQVKKSP